jgi:hypothetical protein
MTMRRLPAALLAATLGLGCPAAAQTIVVATDPMTLERKTVVVETGGPYRLLLCTLPPALSGCRDVTPRRR